MRSLVLLLISTLSLASSSSASALTWLSDPLVGSSTIGRVDVEADDGITTQELRFNSFPAWGQVPGSSLIADADFAGVLEPALQLNSLTLTIGSFSVSGTFGSSVPFTLQYDQVSFSMTGVPLAQTTISDSWTPVGGYPASRGGTHTISYSGSFTALGETLPFAATRQAENGLGAQLSWNGGDVFNLHDVSSFGPLVNTIPIVNIGGVEFRHQFWFDVGDETFSVVPEPSTALLMGFGLAGLAACRRD